MGGRGSKSSRGAAGAPAQSDAEKLGFTGDNLTGYEKSSPEHLASQVAEAKQYGYVRTRNAGGALEDRAIGAPKGAPKFQPDNNAPRGTVMYRDGDKSQPVLVDVARMGGGRARVNAITRDDRQGTRRPGWRTAGHGYTIERNRLQRAEGLPNVHHGTVTAAQIFGK